MLQISQRPLMATEADMALFANREAELARLGRACSLGLNSLVLGGPGAGKTALLHRLELELHAAGRVVLFVDARKLEDVAEITAEVSAARHRQRADARLDVVLLDDVDPDVAFEVFGRHRERMWERDWMWVVAGDAGRRGTYLRPPADAFFDVVLELGELTELAARELLLRRVVHAGSGNEDARRLEALVDALAAEVQPRTPRAMLAAARNALLTSGDPRSTLRRLSILRERASDIGLSAAALFNELLERGPTSASDPELLASLGWTRARAVQVLKQLEEHGLVSSTTEQQAKGRPRTLYAVIEDDAGS